MFFGHDNAHECRKASYYVQRKRSIPAHRPARRDELSRERERRGSNQQVEYSPARRQSPGQFFFPQDRTDVLFGHDEPRQINPFSIH
jgi:hypothetical protein